MSESIAKLEPFILLARSTKGAAAAKVILDATASPGVYVFSELLELPNIQDLKSSEEHQKAYAVLELFAYGTLAEYSRSQDSYPPLTAAHLIKLKHLTLVSLALNHRSLRYDDLLPALQIGSIRELEDMIIDVIYAGLLKGKIHHHERTLHIDWVTGRDVRPSDLTALQKGLNNWCSTASNLLLALDEQIRAVQEQSQKDKALNSEYISHRDSIINSLMDPKSSNTSNNANLGGSRRGQGTRGYRAEEKNSHPREEEILEQLFKARGETFEPGSLGSGVGGGGRVGNGGMPSTSASAAASNQMNQINQAGMPDDPDGSSRGVKRTRELRTP